MWEDDSRVIVEPQAINLARIDPDVRRDCRYPQPTVGAEDTAFERRIPMYTGKHRTGKRTDDLTSTVDSSGKTVGYGRDEAELTAFPHV